MRRMLSSCLPLHFIPTSFAARVIFIQFFDFTKTLHLQIHKCPLIIVRWNISLFICYCLENVTWFRGNVWKARVDVKVEPHSTFTFTRGLLYIVSILFTRGNNTCVHKEKLRDSGYPPLSGNFSKDYAKMTGAPSQ